MAQYLKDEVRARVDRAALSVFAAKGFVGATVAEIARAAGTATGNVYHYYPDKAALFEAVVSDSFARRFMSLMRRRVRSLDGVVDVAELDAGARFHAISEELLEFCIRNRLRVIVLLGRSEATRHDGFARGLVRGLQRMAEAHFRRIDPDLSMTADRRFALDQIYRNWVAAMVEILEAFDDESRIRAAVEAYSQYHLAGLARLLGP
jgi:AcrR family transcriptional regulator